MVSSSWNAVTRNHWVLTLAGNVSLQVVRHRSWKALNDPKPFGTIVFGDPWAHTGGFETLVDAQIAAEDLGRQIVRALADWAAMAKPKVATRTVGKGDRRAETRRLDDKRKAKLHRGVSPTR